jgi:hypothetical protein
MFYQSIKPVLLFVALLILNGCQTPGPGVSPKPPTIGPAAVNGTFWVNEPLTVYFSNHGTMVETNSTVPMNDLYFTNPYAFQVQLGYQFPRAGFEVQQNNAALQVMAARTNSKSRPSQVAQADVLDANGNVIVRAGTVTAWDWPFAATMLARGTPPTDKNSYSIELVNTCNGRIDALGNACTNPDAMMLLTMSPPTQPAAPVDGQVFDYTLVEKGTGNYSNNIATTPVKAIYVQPNNCAIRNLIAPATGKAGDAVTIEFETTHCRRVKLDVAQNVLFDEIAPAHAADVNTSRRYTLPKQLSVAIKLTATDAVNKSVTRSATIHVDPCSISPTHAQCPVNCTANPNDSRCPPNCTATPNDPRCASACPRTSTNPNGELLAWQTNEYCPSFTTIPVTLYGCTFDEAKQAYPPNFGCVYTTITGAPIGECSSGLPKQNYDMCLSCTAQGGGASTLETATARDMCSLGDAKDAAINARKPRDCTFVSVGHCP